MPCECQYYYEGSRSYSAYLPMSCQGSYMPGDEPGIHCSITGDLCENEGDRYYYDCNLQEETETLCPDCLEDGLEIYLVKNGYGTRYCPECHGIF